MSREHERRVRIDGAGFVVGVVRFRFRREREEFELMEQDSLLVLLDFVLEERVRRKKRESLKEGVRRKKREFERGSSKRENKSSKEGVQREKKRVLKREKKSSKERVRKR